MTFFSLTHFLLWFTSTHRMSFEMFSETIGRLHRSMYLTLRKTIAWRKCHRRRGFHIGVLMLQRKPKQKMCSAFDTFFMLSSSLMSDTYFSVPLLLSLNSTRNSDNASTETKSENVLYWRMSFRMGKYDSARNKSYGYNLYSSTYNPTGKLCRSFKD